MFSDLLWSERFMVQPFHISVFPPRPLLCLKPLERLSYWETKEQFYRATTSSPFQEQSFFSLVP